MFVLKDWSSFNLFRALKASLKDLIILPSWYALSNYWKTEVLTEIIPIWKDNPRQLCGALLDPAKFIPLYVTRFLMKQEKVGAPLSPGNYVIDVKVGSDGGRHNWFKWFGGRDKLKLILFKVLFSWK